MVTRKWHKNTVYPKKPFLAKLKPTGTHGVGRGKMRIMKVMRIQSIYNF